MFDPHGFAKESYYEELSKQQTEAMNKLEKVSFSLHSIKWLHLKLEKKNLLEKRRILIESLISLFSFFSLGT